MKILKDKTPGKKSEVSTALNWEIYW